MSSERAARRGLPHNAFETDGAELSRVDRANCGLLSRDSPLLASRPVTFSKWSVRESILNPDYSARDRRAEYVGESCPGSCRSLDPSTCGFRHDCRQTTPRPSRGAGWTDNERTSPKP